jgi:tetratricopeptide (TPR) repeat protein
MVTSRERLRVRGEVEYPVQPLAEPEAVDLFCARAGTEPDDAVRGLCRALDNLPLALELAAARASVLSPQQILARISERLDLLRGGRDADPRQQTLRATIEWSYELLPAEEKLLFARLAVFAGGSTLESAEQVADANLDTLQSLADKSLLRHTDERFWMLETIRDYAADRLEASAESDALRSRHAEHFLALAEGNEPRLRDDELKGGREWLDRLERELDNFRAALDFLEASAETQLALRMAGALSALWANNGHVVEGRRRLEHALAADALPTPARAKALGGAAEMASFSEDTAAMRAWAEGALALYRGLGDRRGIADAMASLGVALGEGGDWTAARQVLEESLGRFRELGDDPRVMWGTRTLAWAYAECGELTRARELYEDALRQARVAGNRLFESVALGSLSWRALREGRLKEASELLKDSLRIKRELGERIETATGLCHAASILAAGGRTDVATRLISCFEAVSEEIGGSYPWVTRMNEKTLSIIRAQLDATAFDIAWQQGSKLTADEAIAIALDALDEVS